MQTHINNLEPPLSTSYQKHQKNKKLSKLNTAAHEFQFDSFTPSGQDFLSSLLDTNINTLQENNNNINDNIDITQQNMQQDNISESQNTNRIKQITTDEENNTISEKNQQILSIKKQNHLESEETNDSKGEDDLDSKISSSNQQQNIDELLHMTDSQNSQKINHISEKQPLKPEEIIHPLSESYVFYYQPRKQLNSNKNMYQQYKSNTIQVGETIKTLEKFLEIYMAIKKPSEWDENHKFCLFKEGNSPLWEQYKDGGCLILSFDKNKWSEAMNNIWELLLFAIIGDQLKTRNETISDNIVGILMNIRSKDNYLEIWLKNSKLKLETALELKYFMNVHDKQPYYFTYHRKSIKAQSMNSGMEELRYSKEKDCYLSQVRTKKGKW